MNHLRIPYEYDADLVSSETSLHCPDETLTRQEFLEESDINTIVRRFGIGEHPVDALQWVTNIDIVDAVDDYQTALNKLIEANEQFMSLPADIRSRFDNDPARFVDFVSTEGNKEEMYRLGLAIKPADPIPSDTDRIIKALEERKAQ